MTQQSKGVVAVSKADSEISTEDVQRAVEAARAIATPLNYEVLHVLPKSFGVDGQTGIKDPVGMTGIRLDVDTQVILGLSSQIKNLTKAVYRAGLEIEDLVLSVIAMSEAVLTHRQKDLGVAVLNLGGSTTSLAVYEEGDLMHHAVLPIGAEHITNDVAIGLRTAIDIAERVKIKYGDCIYEALGKKDEIDLFELGADRHEMIKRKYLSEVIGARVEEIFYKVDQELKSVKRSGLLPAGVILTGGGAKMPGLVEATKKHLRLPAALGYPFNIASVTDKINDLSFSTAIGLVKWGNLMTGTYRRPGTTGKGWQLGAASQQLKKWIKALIP
jgi:cell division protein FtsA